MTATDNTLSSALLQRAVDEFAKLPGIGRKTALRLVLHLLKLDPEAVDPDDVEMLQDMIIAAVNEAINQAETESDELMRGISSGLNLPF